MNNKLGNSKTETKRVINPVTMLFGVGLIIIAIIGMLIEPDDGLIKDLPFGGATIAYLYYISTALFGVGLLYLCRSVLFYLVPYMELHNKAKTTPEGAGLTLIARAIEILAVAIVIFAFIG